MSTVGIQIHNYGHGKEGSYEARLKVLLRGGIHQYGVLNIVGHGDTEEEAVQALRVFMPEVVTKIEEVDYDKREQIAWDGTPSAEYRARMKGQVAV